MRHRLLSFLCAALFLGTATSALIPSHTYAFAKDNGVSQIIAKLNPDVSNAVVKATRHLHYLQGEPDTYTFTRQGSQFISPEMKVPSCSNIDPVDPNKVNEQSTFDVTAYDSTGNTEIGKNDNGGAGFTLCEEQKTVTVNVVPVSQQAKVGSICGTLQYTDLVSNKAAPYQSDSTVTLTGSKALSSDGSKTLTTHTDNNGKYCFKNLPPAAGYSLAAHYGYTDSGGLSQLDSFTKDNITVTAGKTTTIDHVGAASGSSSNASASSTATCESSGASLSWIMCPIINDLISAVDGIYSKFVQPLLYTSPINLTDPQDDPTKVFQIWSNFRVYGDIFLVIALLVVVFGQSLGGGLIDAYAAKKILPRLLLAAIAINLSIYIVALAVDVTNIIGNGINELLTAPFSAAKGGLDLRLSGGASTLGLAALLGGTFWAAISAGALFEFVIAFALLPAFFIFLAILGVVLLRRALIILLVIFAPVAFAMYCLPNTEKYFKQWWELLLKTLIIYPLIATIFAVSHILSATINHAGQTSGLTDTVASIMSIIALIVPLALIPFAFKLAGGILGRVHETLGGLGKRAHQGILGNPNDKDSWRNRSKRKLLARNAQNNLSMRGLGATFNPRTLRPGGQARAERRAARASARNMWDSHYGVEGTAMKMYDRYKDDSNVTGDLALHSSGSASRKAIEDDIAAGKFTRGSAEHQQRLFSSAAADQIGRTPFMRRQALMNSNTVGFELAAGEEGWNQATDVMRELSGFGRDSSGAWNLNSGDHGMYASLMNEFQAVAKGPAGRADLSGNTDGKAYDLHRAYQQHSIYEMANAKGNEVKGFGQGFTKEFDEGMRAGDNDKMEKAAVFYKELEAALPNAKGGTRDMIVEQRANLETMGIGEWMDEDSGRMVQDPATGRMVQATRWVRDPASGRNVQVSETRGDVAQSKARAYERPDPNKI